MGLTSSQRQAIDYFTAYARKHKADAKATIQHILNMSNISGEVFEQAVHHIKSHAQIGLHFHPDRPTSTMKTVAQALLEHGEYKSQFETFISNGKVSPHTGGDRDRWEESMFGGAYHSNGTLMSERPKYGALNLMLHPDGPSPRFGSCYFLLSPNVSSRSTFTYLDSHQNLFEKGTYQEFNMIMAALLEEIFLRDFALGEKNLTPTKFIHHVLNHLEHGRIGHEANRNLNHYIESQIHGAISLKENVDVLVADPSFKDTTVGETLEQMCSKYSIDFKWHMGFVLHVKDIPSDFRGSSMPSLAKRIAYKDRIDAHTIGSAVMSLKRNPDSWSDRGTYEDVLQELKLLWHVLVKYGRPKEK
ncbi:DUF3626 domain-containing protein [Rossellomorea vietnamensis]|uniref:DUF3626 domain-containing protein n=1 Tax=Rossellomorea vietnamensis TaxID=218284 RepID=A0A0P6VY32_9BACI|nr:DUF3626 domain-containing protein [Rossellomorea vietnamensis]KPL57961.1 hypothetical protein AM506_19245 [Rossellomorea vietnamensis]